MHTYTVRLTVESRTGHSWTPVTATCNGIIAAANWRDRMRAWCDTHPLPAGLEFVIPLPRLHRH
ncbi:hypothetical protein [Streptomyces rubradiris]|uniref:Uncharacterized protein n=1 Tax=Streptomyces rubradiris TaxID=285531 RepID=A0ABQ3R3I5_STRRR|nr:hypothetical protein [Streptomyces rubradiris]GHH30069.1 hypothetical protein GCM10018792_76020 [Streptomyces rubradiris]GHI50383.1 hypothetical protein Srubr_02290 [Streptomyces rubradiris]